MTRAHRFFHDAYLNGEANSSPNSNLSICNAATRVHTDESVGFNVKLGRPTTGCFLGTWAMKIKGEP